MDLVPQTPPHSSLTDTEKKMPFSMYIFAENTIKVPHIMMPNAFNFS
jgi:hypothetical protein